LPNINRFASFDQLGHDPIESAVTIDGYVVVPNGSANLDRTWSDELYDGDGQLSLLPNAPLTAAPRVSAFMPESPTIMAAALMSLPLGLGVVRTLRKSRGQAH
jgi:hypothetical protein